MQRIAVMTSGGDAPGMNAAVRAVVRAAIHYDMSVVGFKRGYNGMLMAAKAMSMTGYDVIMNPELRQSSRDAFNATDDLD